MMGLGGKGSSSNSVATTTSTTTANTTNTAVNTLYKTQNTTANTTNTNSGNTNAGNTAINSYDVGLQGDDLTNFLNSGVAIVNSNLQAIEGVANTAVLSENSFGLAQLAAAQSNNATAPVATTHSLTTSDISILLAAAGLVLLLSKK